MAKVYKRGKKWWGRHGTERFPLDTEVKSVAEERLAQWLSGRKDGKWGAEKPLRSFDEAVEKFTAEFLPTLKPAAARRYLVSLIQLAKHFEGKRLHEISRADLHAYEQQRRFKERRSAGTVRRDLSCLSSLYSQAYVWEWVELNPVRPYLEMRAKAKGTAALKEADPRTRYLSHEEETTILRTIQRMIDAGGHGKWTRDTLEMTRAAIMMAIDTGLRKEELLSLVWMNIDLDNEQVTVRAEKAKTGKGRQVPLLPRTRRLLVAHRRHFQNQYVFWHGTHAIRRYASLLPVLKTVCVEAGIPDVRWHDLRRTCGCRLLQDHKLSMELVSKWLGHASIEETQRAYAFLETSHLHAAVGTGQEGVQLRELAVLRLTAQN